MKIAIVFLLIVATTIQVAQLREINKKGYLPELTSLTGGFQDYDVDGDSVITPDVIFQSYIRILKSFPTKQFLNFFSRNTKNAPKWPVGTAMGMA